MAEQQPVTISWVEQTPEVLMLGEVPLLVLTEQLPVAIDWSV
jgi:hypothetical protein